MHSLNQVPSNPSILFIGPSAYPIGGVATWLDYLVPGLQRNWNVTVALTSGVFHDVDAYRRAHPLDAISIPCGSGTRESRITNLATAIASVDPDIVAFVNVPDTAIAVDRLRSNARWSGKSVMVVHGLEPEPMADCSQIGRSLDAVVCTNRLACELTNKIGGVAAERIYYAPYGIRMAPNSASRTIGRGDGKIRLGYVGRFEQHQKRVLDLSDLGVELVRRNIPFTLCIAGGGPDEESLKASLANLPDECVNFLGQIPPNQIDRLVYPNLDILLIPSLWETGPIVAWEAMASGVPVLSARFIGSGLEGRLRHKENCQMFSIGDMLAAADSVEELRDYGKRAEIAQNAYRYVADNCTQQQSIATFDDSFSKILQGKSISAASPSLDESLAQRAGRLDTVFGTRMGERIRSFLRISTPHSSAGGEWPHTFASRQQVDMRYWSLAAQRDGVYLPEAAA